MLRAFDPVAPYYERMRRSLLLFIGFSLWANLAWGYELCVVQAVSASKRSFVIRNGKRQGVTAEMSATFVSDDVAVIARAKTVTSQYTQWELANEDGTVPFKVGDIVTYHPSQDYLWSLNPSEARRRYVEELRPQIRHSFLLKGASTRALSETTSNANPNNASRGGIALDALYERLFTPNFAWDAGVRYEREVVNLPAGSLITQRALLMADILYYFDPAESFYDARFYFGLGAGFGQSSTAADGVRQSGTALLLPSAKLGLNLPFDKTWSAVFEGAFESIKTHEKIQNLGYQDTTQSNLRVAVGLRRFF